MRIISKLLRGRNASTPNPRPSRRMAPCRLGLETLEDRTLLSAAVFVVPTTQTADSTHFYNLQSAINAAGPGGSVTIEPGSAPGDGTVSSAGLTIQGDPGSAASSLPPINLTLTGTASSSTLLNLNLGSLTIDASNVSLTDSIVTFATLGTGTSGLTIENNLFTGSATTLSPAGLTGTQTSGDVIAFNTFNISNSVGGPSFEAMLALSSSSGITIQQNTFNGGGDFQEGIVLQDDANINVLNNQVRLQAPSLNTIALLIDYTQVLTSSITVENNVLSASSAGTAQGIGLFIDTTNNTNTNVQVLVQNNDFHNNAIGIDYASNAADTTTPGSDFGGGAAGSLGLNNFRSFTATASATSGAIVVQGLNPALTLSAENNLFANGVSPGNVVTPAAQIVLGNGVQNPSAFVQTLYFNLLGRTAASSEVSFWTSVFNGSGQGAVASGILNSTESYNTIVNNLYIQLLGRTADSGGLSFWTSILQGGGTLETVEAGILASTEYINRAGSNIVTSYYVQLLGRTPSSSELSFWNSVLFTQGANAVALGILGSTEYRTDFTTHLYQQLLHRQPAAGEVAVWADNTSLNLLQIEAGILSSTEYLNNG